MPEPTAAPATPSSSRTPLTGAFLDVEGLRAAIADAVLATPGVVRLEPTLRTAGLRGLARRQPTDGVQLTVRSTIVDTDINVATSGAYQARGVAEQLHHRVVGLLTGAGRSRGSITINVLIIEPFTT